MQTSQTQTNGPRPPEGRIASQADEPLRIMGGLRRDGFKILHSNEKTNQDAFAVSKDRNTFVICDGMGSYRKSGTLARMLAPLVATYLRAEAPKDQKEFGTMLHGMLRQIMAMPEFQNSKENHNNFKLEEGANTTLTVANRVGPRAFECFIFGDSPAVVLRSNSQTQGLGFELAGQQGTGIGLGIMNNRVDLNIKSAQSFSISLNPGDQLLMASDWLDNLWLPSRDGGAQQAKRLLDELAAARRTGVFTHPNDDAGSFQIFNPEYEKNMKGFIAAQQRVAATGKPFQPQSLANISLLAELRAIVNGDRPGDYPVNKKDDATMIFIDPDGLPPFVAKR